MTFNSTVGTDRWVKCMDDSWVRWGSIDAIDIVHDRGAGHHEVVLVSPGCRLRTYGRFDTREAAVDVIKKLLQSLSGDYG